MNQEATTNNDLSESISMTTTGDRDHTITDLLQESIKHGLLMTQGDEPFFPFMFLVTGKTCSLNVLTADDIKSSLDSATGFIDRLDDLPSMYALVWDGRITINETKSDCIFVEIGSDSHINAQIIAQPYSGSDPATALGEPIGLQTTESRILLCKKIGPFNYIEWNKIVALPMLTFFLVAEADGDIDAKEISAFAIRTRQATDTNDLFSSLLISSSNNLSEIHSDISSPNYDKWQNLESIVKIIRKNLESKDFEKLRSETLQFAESIAKKPGGFLGFGGGIGKKERIIIERIKETLHT